MSVIPFSFWKSSTAVFDPATLSLSGWWRADTTTGEYDGSPWAPTASAGGSGSAGNLSNANAPSVGATQNGYAPADFIPANNDELTGPTGSGLWTTTAGTVIVLFYADAAAADAGAGVPYANPMLVTMETGPWVMMGYSDSGLRSAIHDGGYKEPAAIACGTGAWHMGMMRWDASTLEQSVDGGSTTSVGISTLTGVGTAMRVGTNYNGAAFFDGRMLEIITLNTKIPDADVGNVKSYFNSRYALAL